MSTEAPASAGGARHDRSGSLPDRLADELDQQLAEADAALARDFPGERPGRQPVHTVYVPADRFESGISAAWGLAALQALDAHRAEFHHALVHSTPGADDNVDPDDLEAAVRRKLETEPVEDLRIDFEDGYGRRPDAEEDAEVDHAVRLLLAANADGTAPPFTGIRFASFEAPTRRRGVRTLTRFVAGLAVGGGLPDGFVVTLPKVTSVEQVEAMVHVAQRLETEFALGSSLRFEIQVETPQAVLGPDGTALVARMIHASAGRCTGLHYGTYDYSASTGIAAAHQSMEHPVADHAKAVMQVAAAGTGVRLSDGSTNVLPVGDAQAVGSAWALHHRLVRRSLERGFYQGWDLHPAQLPTRYAAVFAFYRGDAVAATTRLRHYVDRSGSGVLDEPATARALADFVLRGLDCGALDPTQVTAACGLDRPALSTLARRA